MRIVILWIKVVILEFKVRRRLRENNRLRKEIERTRQELILLRQ